MCLKAAFKFFRKPAFWIPSRNILALSIAYFILQQGVFAFEFPWSDALYNYKQKRLEKKQESEAEPMVQTVQEWMERATDIRMEHRISEPYKEEENPNLVKKLEWPVFFEKYNNTPGSRELNLEKLKMDKNFRSKGVISPNFKLMAYTECYYYPSNRQTTSAFFIYPLDTMKGKKQRIIEANVFSGAKKKPLISSTNEDLKTAFFSAFTIVDWSKDNKRVLLKEKTGSEFNGIYQTNIWVYFIEDEDLSESDGNIGNNSDEYSVDEPANFEGRAVKFDELNETIKQYWFSKELLNLNHYRWDIKPLGFLASDENIVICASYTYDKKNKEHIFLGTWGINVMTGEISLLSESVNETYEISTNGVVLIRRLP